VNLKVVFCGRQSFYKRASFAAVRQVHSRCQYHGASRKHEDASAAVLRSDLTGAALYILAYGGMGFLFRDFLAAITRGFQTAGHVFGEVLFTAALVYTGYRVWIYRKNLVYKVVPRVQVEELARKLASDEATRVLLVDVRSHGYYDPDASRIKGSVRIEPNNLYEELKTLPHDKDIYLYCT
jgi:hypothetical protein